MNFVYDTYNSIASSIIFVVSTFLPKFIAGLLILFIGVIIASLARDLTRALFKYLRFEEWLENAGVVKAREIRIWPGLFSEILRWAIIFLFLISAVETWQIPKVGDVLNQLLQFFPNVFLAVIIGWIGLVAGRFSFDIVRHGVDGVGGKESIILGNVAKFAIYFFTALIILTQLGVAADLVKILFTGIVGMFSLAFGLSFGLGGQDEAKNILKMLRQRIEIQSKISSTKSKSVKN